MTSSECRLRLAFFFLQNSCILSRAVPGMPENGRRQRFKAASSHTESEIGLHESSVPTSWKSEACEVHWQFFCYPAAEPHVSTSASNSDLMAHGRVGAGGAFFVQLMQGSVCPKNEAEDGLRDAFRVAPVVCQHLRELNYLACEAGANLVEAFRQLKRGSCRVPVAIQEALPLITAK